MFQTIQFSISTQSDCQKYFHFKLFMQLYVTIHLSVNTVLIVKTFLFQAIQVTQTIHFSISMSLVLFNP